MGGTILSVSADFRDQFVVRPGHKLHLKDRDPDFRGPYNNHAAAAQAMQTYLDRLSQLQALLYADKRYALLIVLQALDAGGKDGTIKHVFGAFNPQGTTVTSFRAPTPVELEHDFLWRVHPHTPGKGQIAVFNRSHYEDVLVTRVHGLIDKATWTARYGFIRDFEQGLVASNTRIIKFFLHISPEEQLDRFEKRLTDPTRNWKISESDYIERERWDDYIQAFEDALSETSTAEAPWYVIPSDHKWFRRLLVARIVTATLEEMDPRWPEPEEDLEQFAAEELDQLSRR